MTKGKDYETIVAMCAVRSICYTYCEGPFGSETLDTLFARDLCFVDFFGGDILRAVFFGYSQLRWLTVSAVPPGFFGVTSFWGTGTAYL